MKTEVTSGDISSFPSEVLVTAINSSGVWFGGIDGVIQRAAGHMFHSQAQVAMPLTDGQTVVARKTGEHFGSFENVIFVIDDLQKPLSAIVFAGLKAAAEAGFKRVSLPTIRPTGRVNVATGQPQYLQRPTDDFTHRSAKLKNSFIQRLFLFL